jgi:hypothetical protein
MIMQRLGVGAPTQAIDGRVAFKPTIGEIRRPVQSAWRAAPAAAARRQAGHRQSSPELGAGMGARTGSAAHQQSLPRPHWKAVPQRAQSSSREGT